MLLEITGASPLHIFLSAQEKPKLRKNRIDKMLKSAQNQKKLGIKLLGQAVVTTYSHKLINFEKDISMNI